MGFIYSWIQELTPNASNCATDTKIEQSHKRASVYMTFEEVEGFFQMVLTSGLLAGLASFILERMFSSVYERFVMRGM